MTRRRLPQTTWADGSVVRMAHGYLRKAGASELVDDKFVKYVAVEPRAMLAPAGGISASEKRRLLRGRILLKVASAKRAARIEKREEANRSATTLVNSSILAVEAESEVIDERAVDAIGVGCDWC